MPASPRFGDVYRSRGNQGDAGLAQARHVFLKGCGLLRGHPAAQDSAAWAHAPSWQLLETGFGLGLNFLATWHAWRADPERPRRLFYSSVEAWPPEPDHILRSAAPFPELLPLAQELAARWQGLLPGLHRLEFEEGRLQLTLAVGDAQRMLSELAGRYDSIYLDGFSPARNPDMWSLHTLKAVARLAQRGARAASWCVAGEVRERLTSCGFQVERVPGLPPKRHALRAIYDPAWQPRVREAGLNLPLPTKATPSRCVVIGAGLAGASCAYALALRGWQVTVLERGPNPAAGASGLPAGVVAPHVSPDDRPLSRLTRAGARATLQRARQLLQEGDDFLASGVLERHAPGERRLPPEWAAKAGSAAGRANTHTATEPVTIEKAGQAGVPMDDAHLALWHAHAGWLKPAALVKAMLDTPGIEWHPNRAADRLECADNGVWRTLDADDTILAESELVVISAGFDSKALASSLTSFTAPPLHPLRGQVAFGPMPDDGTTQSSLPVFPINGKGSLIAHVPSADGPIWVTGSSFQRGNTQAELLEADHAFNRARLAQLLPAAASVLDAQWPDGRAHAWSAIRATLPDRLPAVGSWPGANMTGVVISPASSTPLPLQICAGMGARGLTLAVLMGDILAAWLHHEPLPVERSLAESVRAERWSAKEGSHLGGQG